MAVLSFTFCCSKPKSFLPSTSRLSYPHLPIFQIPNSSQLHFQFPLTSCLNPTNIHETAKSYTQEQAQIKFSNNSSINFGESVSKACITALISASLFFAADPALAFKGGGPYGSEVTRGQDLTGKDFSGRTLIKQDFKTSILRQANFKAAKLLGASFFDSDLTGADLSDADLRGADFSLANVAKANLTNANLEGALVTGNTSFKGSIITGADFTDVPFREDQKEYLCKIADGVNPVTGNETRETLFCK